MGPKIGSFLAKIGYFQQPIHVGLLPGYCRQFSGHLRQDQAKISNFCQK